MCIFRQEKEIMEKSKCDLLCGEHRVGSKFHTLSSSECEIIKFTFEFHGQRLCEILTNDCQGGCGTQLHLVLL